MAAPAKAHVESCKKWCWDSESVMRQWGSQASCQPAPRGGCDIRHELVDGMVALAALHLLQVECLKTWDICRGRRGRVGDA